MEGTIVKTLSGFYYVLSSGVLYECRGRGKLRLDGVSPLVGDRVSISVDSNRKGSVDKIFDRRNFFIRPAVANIDALVFVAANTNPVTDPFLIDRVSVIAQEAGCEFIVCINKTDIDPAQELYETYVSSGFKTVRTSAVSSEGVDELLGLMKGKICAFTGNSGVGKSSLLNCISPEFGIRVDEVSKKLGRGKHTTRHVELYGIGEDTYIADTPGFASFDIEMMQSISKSELQYDFREFRPHLGSCRFADCAHLKEPDCSVLSALERGEIQKSRYESYRRLYELAAQRSLER